MLDVYFYEAFEEEEKALKLTMGEQKLLKNEMRLSIKLKLRNIQK